MIYTRVSHITKEVIYKSIDLHASRARVWEVLTRESYNMLWYAGFNPGSYAKTDWQLGSKVRIDNGNGFGLVGRVVENDPDTALKIEYIGFLENGREDLESEDAGNVRGFTEGYKLYEEAGVTTLSIEQETSREYLSLFLNMWDEALLKIKELVEYRESLENK
ncbi:MAG: SRPBCC domain-containing protein [Owenweeksia sp.]